MKIEWIPTFDEDNGWTIVPLRDITAFRVNDYNEKPRVFTQKHGWLFVEYPPSLSALWKWLEDLNRGETESAWRTLALDAAEMVSFKEAAWHQRLEQLLKEK